jgi:NTP pyrophosphatase (non-canonical NTP hydrolase)
MGGGRPVTVTQFEGHAAATDQLGDLDLDTAVLGLVGEVGSLVSALKKKRRDTDGFFGYHDSVVEELGDVLWYASAVARRGGNSLVEVVARAASWAGTAESVRFENLAPAVSSEAEAFEASLLVLAGEAGDLAKRFAVGAYRNNPDALRGDLIKFVRPLLTQPRQQRCGCGTEHRKTRGSLANGAPISGAHRRGLARGRATPSQDASADLRARGQRDEVCLSEIRRYTAR